VLIALTGYGEESDRKASLDAGFDHHLVKPVNAATLISILDARTLDGYDSGLVLSHCLKGELVVGAATPNRPKKTRSRGAG